ncbi:MAG TPA: DUF4214 domain-containing protein, partial [Pyrinomonadaceae bacterium]|nr:DUF4214 domain-containing protein [Pyrinomonadaceae bacterium]
KTLTIPIINDAHAENTELFNVILRNPSGSTVGEQGTSLVVILDDDTFGFSGPNPIFTSQFFVRMQYLDFLSREPDADGYAAWLRVLNNCSDVNNNPLCDRITVSSSFFRSQEFQLKGYFVYRFYKASLGRLPRYEEIIPDMRRVTGQTADEVNLKRDAFTDAWVTRADFRALYDGLSNAAYVDRLIQTAGVKSFDRGDLVAALDGGAKTRAQVLRLVVDSPEVYGKEYNGAFVAMQYFGYLRRDPDTGGYNNWLRVLDANPVDYRTMVGGFINSLEYRLRYGDPNK